MRKDVKPGMAIGGGLISVLVGYLLFAPPAANNKKGTQLVNANGGSAPRGSIIDPPAPGELTRGADNPAPKAPRAVAAATGTADQHATAPAAPGEAVAEPGTHIVRAGETLSGIALQAYGSSSFYPHILRANPGLNANNLKLGAVIKLPKL